MPPKDNLSPLDQLDAMRRALIERAFDLDRAGHPVAADLAMETAARLSELHDNFACSSSAPENRSALGNLMPAR